MLSHVIDNDCDGGDDIYDTKFGDCSGAYV